MRATLLIVLAIMPSASLAQQVADQWHRLIDSKKIAEAESICTKWANSADLTERVEARKCLANVALARGQVVSLLGNDSGGGTLGEGYSPEALDKAIKYLDEGIALAPQDLSIHQGRLHLLEVSGRFDSMAKALDESATIYKGKDGLEAWLAYAAELGDMGQARAGLEISEVLNRHFPNSHDVIGNIGAFYSMLKEPAAALPYLKKAVDLAPNDPIDTWNLGRAYDRQNQDESADRWYSKSLSLDPSSEDSRERKCLYGEFVEKKRHQKLAGCKLQKANCDQDEPTDCGPGSKEHSPAN